MTDNKHSNRCAARFGADLDAVEVSHLRIADADVIREAKHWATGERGPFVDAPEQLAAADLANFVTAALGLGARTMSAVGQAQESQALAHLIKDVGERATSSSAQAADATTKASREAAKAIAEAAVEARKAVAESDRAQRKQFTESVTKASADLKAELARLLGGESPELVERLKPVVDRFGADVEARATKQVDELVAKAARQFDPSDPTSPMAKQAAILKQQYDELAKALAESSAAVTEKLGSLEKAVAVEQAVGKLAKVTPIKGFEYEHGIHQVLTEIATGLGDEYEETGTSTGRIARCKKGDGVLTVGDGNARVVIEVTDSPRSGWIEYLDEAERNRDAAASIGLVPSVNRNHGHAVRILGARRIVLAFDPRTDDPDLLRTVVLLMRAAARLALSAGDGRGIDEAAKAINAAMGDLLKIDAIKKTASAIGKNAQTIERQCDAIGSGIRRSLDEALAALDGARDGARDDSPCDSSTSTDHGAA